MATGKPPGIKSEAAKEIPCGFNTLLHLSYAISFKILLFYYVTASADVNGNIW
jgi:hypothetical protein